MYINYIADTCDMCHHPQVASMDPKAEVVLKIADLGISKLKEDVRAQLLTHLVRFYSHHMHARAHAHTRTHARARTHAHARTRTHTPTYVRTHAVLFFFSFADCNMVVSNRL